MKKVTILGLHFNFGGIETATANLANMICNHYEVKIIVLYDFKTKIPYDLDPKIKIEYLTDLIPNKDEFISSLKKKKFLTCFKEGIKSIKILKEKRKKMIEAIKNDNSNIIISTRLYFHELVSKYTKDSQIKILQEHAHHNNNAKYIAKVIKACQNADYLMPVSNELTNFYKEYVEPRTKCHFIKLPINKIPSKIKYTNTKKLICVGRLSKEKGHLDLIDVFYEAQRKISELELFIYGDGNMRSELETKINNYNIADKVRMCGFQKLDVINKQYENSSLFILPSFEESFGLVLIEAMAYGIPCLSFETPRGPHEIINGRNGIIINGRDKEEMVNQIVTLLVDETKLKEMSKEAYKTANEYSFDEIKKQWLMFLDDISK